MKKILIFMIFSLGMFANELSLKIHKETNGSYLVAMPSLHYEETSGFFIHKVDFDLLFTAPRGNYTNLNHYGIVYNNHFGFSNTDFFVTMSLDLKYVFEENDYREEPG